MSDYVLGLSAYYHDSAAALLCDGRIVAAAQEERFTRKKHDPAFPVRAVEYVLEAGNVSLEDVRGIAFYEKPLLKFERLLETYHAFAPHGFTSFLASVPVWIKEKLFMETMMERSLGEFLGPEADLKKLPKIYYPEHHLSHAASAFYPSPFNEAAIVTVDGVGEWASTSISHGQGSSISSLTKIHFPHSLGLLYSAFTVYCGFKVNSGEYKLMGLAPYGNPRGERARQFENKIREELIDIRPDGSYVLNMPYFRYATGLSMYDPERWLKLFGLPPRTAEDKDIDPAYMDMALAIQRVTEDVVLRLAATAKNMTGSSNICLAGGVALNCVANGKILRSNLFDRLWTQPASGDAGGALGAALALWHIGFEAPRQADEKNDAMQGAYLGPAFGNDAAVETCRRFGAPFEIIDTEEALSRRVAGLLNQGQVVGWFQGRMEYGPRALGNRSILGDARNPEMQKRLNLKIKYREGFRPFAPSVTEEGSHDYFDFKGTSPYMLLTVPVAESIRQKLPENYDQMDMWERLYFLRSTLPAITHIDYSARIQTVNKEVNPRYWGLLKAFEELSGCPVVVNTSFNVRGEPVVCTPADAYRCFMRTDMDYLVINDLLLDKTSQPPLKENADWRTQFVLD